MDADGCVLTLSKWDRGAAGALGVARGSRDARSWIAVLQAREGWRVGRAMREAWVARCAKLDRGAAGARGVAHKAAIAENGPRGRTRGGT
jgi:hypothetical protein